MAKPSPVLGVLWTSTGCIRICENDDTWQTARRAFLDGAPADRLCTALDFAASMVHELTHSCMRQELEDDDPGLWFDSYLIENILRWALVTRYPSVTGSPCCRRNTGVSPDPDDRTPGDIGVFASDNLVTIPDGCAEASAQSGGSGWVHAKIDRSVKSF